MSIKISTKDQALVLDMRNSAKEAIGFVKGLSEARFKKDLKTRRAVERCLEVIGEAARSLSPAAKRHWKNFPFEQVIGMRNVLAHDYAAIESDELWTTVKRDLPNLLKDLK